MRTFTPTLPLPFFTRTSKPLTYCLTRTTRQRSLTLVLQVRTGIGVGIRAPVDEYEIATVVQGTCGYLDPEYLPTYHFTDKSDVSSLGVILVELLTRRKPLRLLGPEDQKGLATTFISFLKRGKLENIIDLEILEEADGETLREISQLAGRCLCVKRTDRPTMKEVSMALQIWGLPTNIRGFRNTLPVKRKAY